MLIPEIIRIYNEFGRSNNLHELERDYYLNGDTAYNIKVGDLLLEYRPGITISFEEMETSQLRVYLNRKPGRPVMETILTVVGFTRNVYHGYHEILISKHNRFHKAIINSNDVPIHDYVCEKVSGSISLWEMTEEERFQFSLVDFSYDMAAHEDVKKQVQLSHSSVTPGLSILVSYDPKCMNHPDLNVLYGFTVKK